MFHYEIQDRDFKPGHRLFIFTQDEVAIGSLFLSIEMENAVKSFLHELNDFDSPSKQRARDGIQTFTGEVTENSRGDSNILSKG